MKCVCGFFFNEHILYFLVLFSIRCHLKLCFHSWPQQLHNLHSIHPFHVTSSTCVFFLSSVIVLIEKGDHYLPQLFLYTTFRPLALSKQTPSARNAQWFTQRSSLGRGITQSAKARPVFCLDAWKPPRWTNLTAVQNKCLLCRKTGNVVLK